MNRFATIFIALVFAALALVPLATGSFGIDLVTKIMIFAILALSLELLVGSTGLVCFGQAAFFGIGAYAAVLLSPQDGVPPLVWLLPASILAAAAYALVVGALSLRTKGVYFIMVTLAFAQMAYYVVHDTPLGGGTDGIYMGAKPVLVAGLAVQALGAGAYVFANQLGELYALSIVFGIAIVTFFAGFQSRLANA